MNYLTIEDLSKTYGEKVLFRDLNMYINQGERVALVAKNGSGKTTLLRVLAGLEGGEGERGKVLINKSVRIAFLQQEPQFIENHSIFDAILESNSPQMRAVKAYEKAKLHPEQPELLEKAMHEMDDCKAWDQEARIEEILAHLKIPFADKQVSLLSGGQKKRVALARVLIEEPDFLILDEPTNHLDLEMIEWLEKYLQQPGITLFTVTHDRYFLDAVCNTIYELDRGQMVKYSGNYGDYLEKKALRQENEASTLDRNRNIMRRELEWMRRQPKARGTKAKSRVDDFYELQDKTTVRKDRDTMQIDLKAERLGSKILEAHHVSKSYGDLKLVTDFSYKFKRKDRVGIVGPNGTGKSTLLGILAGQIQSDTGKVIQGETLQLGYYNQSGMELPTDKRVIDVITSIAEVIPLEKGQHITAAGLLERFLFSRSQQQVYVSQLSGGERRRLYLLTVLMRNPNFLILDEPTNDLDILTLNVLEDYLDSYPGILLIVSHDRYFMDRLVEHIFVFEGAGKVSDFPGNYSEYRENLREATSPKKVSTTEKQQLQAPVEKAEALSYEERKELQKLEREIKKYEEQKLEISEKFNAADLQADQILKLSKQLSEISKNIEARESRWMVLAEKAG